MVKTNRKWKGLKTSGIVIGITLLVLAGGYLWLSFRSSHIIQEIVERESNGRIKTTIGSFKFNYRSLRLDIVNLGLTGIDTKDGSPDFRFKAPRLSLQLKSFWTFVWHKQLDIDSIICASPGIEIYNAPNDKRRTGSISEEIGKVYVSIQDVLNSLNIKRLEIRKGRINIIDKYAHGDTLALSDIFFRVDNLHVDTAQLGTQPFLFSDDIILQTNNQDITWDQGDRRLRFKRFYINTRENLIEIDSCYISGSKKDVNTGSFNVLIDSVKLVNPNFQALYLADNLEVDSIFCFTPRLKLQLMLKENDAEKQSSRQILERTLQNLTGDLAVKYVGVKNADLSVVTQKGERITSFNSSQNNFSLDDIVINNNNEQPVTIGHIDLAIRNYLSYTPDSVYAIRFDSIHIVRNRMILDNFTIATSPNANVSVKGTYSIKRFVLTDVSWADLLLDKQLDAREAMLYKPDIQVVVQAAKNSKRKNKLSLYQIFSILNDNFRLDKFSIRGGSIYFKPSPGVLLQLKEADADIDAGMLLESENIGNIGEAITHAAIKSLSFQGRRSALSLNNVLMNGAEGALHTEALEFKGIESRELIKARGLYIKGLSVENDLLSADSLSWQEGELIIGKGGKTPGAFPAVDFKVGYVNGNHTTLEAFAGKYAIKARLDKLTAPLIAADSGRLHLENGAAVKGSLLRISSDEASIEGSSFILQDDAASGIKDLIYTNNSAENKFTLASPEVSFAMDLNKLVNRKEYLVNTLTIHQPEFSFRHSGDQDTLTVSAPGRGAEGDPAVITIDSLQVKAGKWAAVLRTWRMYDMTLMRKKEMEPFSLTFSSFGVDSLQIGSALIKDPAGLFTGNRGPVLKNVSGRILSPTHIIDWSNGYYNNRLRYGRVDNFSYAPRASRDSFVASHPWQTDYINVHTGTIELFNTDPGDYLRTSVLTADRIVLHEPVITLYRDKRLPFEAGIIKPLTTDLIGRIPLPLSIDTVGIKKGSVIYTEVSEKTGMEGSLSFTRLDGRIYSFKNSGIKASDTFKIKAAAWLMDTAWLQLTVQQAYTDTPARFAMDVRMRPTQLSFLNPLLIPAVSLKLVSGQLDTLHLQAICGDEVASGKITLLYHKLKIALLKRGDESRKDILSGIASFLANRLLINNKNEKRTEDIVFHRNRDRSVFNYWIKITMRGVATSVGIRTNKKEIRRYRKSAGGAEIPAVQL